MTQVILYWSYEQGYRLYMTDKPFLVSDNDLVAKIPIYRGGYAEQFAGVVCKHIGASHYWNINSDNGQGSKVHV